MLLLSILVGLGSILTNQSWKKTQIFCTRLKDPFISGAGKSLSGFAGEGFQYIHNMSKCSIPWSLSLSHAVLACKSKIWWLIHHSCLALLLIAFLAVWGEAKNMDLPWLGRQHCSGGVCEQPTVGCSWQHQLLTVDNIVEHLSHEFSLEKRRFGATSL